MSLPFVCKGDNLARNSPSAFIVSPIKMALVSRSAVLLLLLSTLASDGFAAVQFDWPCYPLPFSYFWNVGDENPKTLDLTKFIIFSANYTQTGDGCNQPNCQKWSQGLFPTINEDGSMVNGGVPQRANLTAHIQVLEKTVIKWIPEADWSGHAVLDFEDWTTVWDFNTGSGSWHSVRYQNYSIELVMKQHPTWPKTQVIAEAKKEFEAAATEFFVQTLETCRRMRPKAAWGFYGLPLNVYEPCMGTGEDTKCGYDFPGIGPMLRKYSDQQIPVWKASTALYPSIYIPDGHTTDDNAAYVRSTVRETVRCAGNAGDIPVFPFMWNYYHSGNSLLSATDLQSSMLLPYDLKAAGNIMWGSSAELNNATFLDYIEKNTGPLAVKFITSMCDCSKQNCNGHGRCMPSSSTACQCYPGYSGQHCVTKL